LARLVENCHWNENPGGVRRPSGSPIRAVLAFIVCPSCGVVSLIVGVPVAGRLGGGAAVAVPVRAIVCVLPATPPELFVAIRFADFGPAGLTGWNVTLTVQLAPGWRVVPQVVVPRPKFAVSDTVNRAAGAAGSVSAFRPLLVSVNDRAALVVPTCWLPKFGLTPALGVRARSARWRRRCR
jgi:hypothetical protein